MARPTSLRATGATELYRAEKIIKERTGHPSLEALWMYERISESQHEAVSNILASDKETTFTAQMQKTSLVEQTSVPNNSTPTMNFIKDCSVNITINQGGNASSNCRPIPCQPARTSLIPAIRGRTRTLYHHHTNAKTSLHYRKKV